MHANDLISAVLICSHACKEHHYKSCCLQLCGAEILLLGNAKWIKYSCNCWCGAKHFSCFHTVFVFEEQASYPGGATVSELSLPQTAAVAGAVGCCFALAPAVRWSPHCVVWPWPAPVWPGSSPLPLGLVSPDPDVTNYGWGVSGESEWVETDVWMEKK